MFTYTLDHRGDQVLLALAGEADVTVGAELRAAVGWALAAGPRALTIDVDDLTFIDCAAVGVLVAARHEMTGAGGTFTLTNAHGLVRHALEALGLVTDLTGQPAPAYHTDR